VSRAQQTDIACPTKNGARLANDVDLVIDMFNLVLRDPMIGTLHLVLQDQTIVILYLTANVGHVAFART